MARNDQNWDDQSRSYNSNRNRNQSDWDDDFRLGQDNGRYGNSGYGSASYGRSRMDMNDYQNTGYNNEHQNTNSRHNEQWAGNNYNDRSGMENNQYRNQMESMSGNRDYNSWNDRGGNHGSSYGNEFGNRRNTSGNYGERSSRNYGGGNTNAGDYRGNRDYEDRDHGGSSNPGRDLWDWTKGKVSQFFSDDQQRGSGPHRGKGPKDYQRSEQRIREDVCDRLSDDDRIDASNVQVQIQNNEVILTGTVRSKEEKRRAEDLVESISGVRNVENRLRVSYDDSNSLFGGSAGSARTTGSDTTGTERSGIR